VAGKPAQAPLVEAPPNPAAPVRAVPPAAANAASAGDAASKAALDRPWDRMILRSASLTLQVADVEKALADARAIAERSGGFVSASNTRLERTGDQERTIATISIQVRSELYDSAVSELRRLAVKVESENGTSQDVTEEYVDLDANLRNLQRTEAQMLTLMDKAQRMDDILALQRELTNVRGQIERIQGRKRFLERRSDMSQITLTLQPAPSALESETTLPVRGWNPAATARTGWLASLRVLRTLADGLILALSFGWWLLAIAVPIFGLLFARQARRVRRHDAHVDAHVIDVEAGGV
jgi:hypothetical protein